MLNETFYVIFKHSAGEATFRFFFLKRGNEQSKAQIFDKRDQDELTEENEVVCIMGLYLNLVSVMIKADPCDNGTGVQESASWVL